MKSIGEINQKIEKKEALVLSADEVFDYVEKKGLDQAAKEVDVVTTATFGPMCSSGCFLNFGHSKPKIRITEGWLDDVAVYCGLAAVDVFLGATQLRHNDSANMYYPGEFRFGGGHVMEKLIRGEEVQLFALSYATDDYPRRELRTHFTINDLNQAIMVNPRNAYQNYNIATNSSEKDVYTYLGHLKPRMQNISYSSAGQLSPLLNDPYYRTIGIGSRIWLAGAQGIVYAEGTQHASLCQRNEMGVPMEGAGTLALSADMKKMKPRFVRGLSLKGYGASLAVGVGVPIPVLDKDVLKAACVRDKDISGQLIDYSVDYPQKTGKVLAQLTYEDLKQGEVKIDGKIIRTASMSSYPMALEIANLLKEEIQRGEFLVSAPLSLLPKEQGMQSLEIKGGQS